MRGDCSLEGNGTHLFVPIMPIYDTSTHLWWCAQIQHICTQELNIYLANSALFWIWPFYSLPSALRVDWIAGVLLQNKPPLAIIRNWGRKERNKRLWYKSPLLNYVFSRSLSYIHTHIHTVQTFYILDFSFLRFPLRAVCCHLISSPLFLGRAHRGVDSVAPLAWSGSSLLFLQQSHLSQDQAVDVQLHLLTPNLCRVGGSGKGFLCEG